MRENINSASSGMKSGEWVEVRSQEEILATLDENARVDELPFMPQMLQYCGQKFQVDKHLHKMCCLATDASGRKMSNAVTLEALRCDGLVYGGCEMKCMIIWKEAWLKRVDPCKAGLPPRRLGETVNVVQGSKNGKGCSVAGIYAGTQAPYKDGPSMNPVFVCQATQIPHATEPLSQWSLGQYYQDYVSGNVPIQSIISRLLLLFYRDFLVASGLGLGSVFRWTYDTFERIAGRTPFPWRKGVLPKDGRTPTANLNLQVGEQVRIRQYSEIQKTLDESGRNRGLIFAPELASHCGKTFRVAQRVQKLMNESTGQLMVLKNECLVLEGANCDGKTTNPLNCPRASFPYWREIWLERVADKALAGPKTNADVVSAK